MQKTPETGVPYFGMSDDGDLRKPTILQIVNWKKTGPLVNLNPNSKRASRVDITGPYGNAIGRRLCLDMLIRARDEIETTNFIFTKVSRVADKLRIKNLERYQLVDDEHDILQILYFPYTGHIRGLGEIEILGPKDDRYLALNMIERARQFLEGEVFQCVPAVSFGLMEDARIK